MAGGFSLSNFDRQCRPGWYPAGGVPPGARWSQHGRRLQPHHQRQNDRGLYHAAGTRCRKCFWRRGPGLCRFDSHPAATGRTGAHPHAGPSQLRCGSQLSGDYQVVCQYQCRESHPGNDAPGFQPAETRSPGTGPAGDSPRCGSGRISRR